jgi:hypothetical protein
MQELTRINSTLFVRNISLLSGPISPPSLSRAYYKPANMPLISIPLQGDELLLMERSGNKDRPEARPSIIQSKVYRGVTDSGPPAKPDKRKQDGIGLSEHADRPSS